MSEMFGAFAFFHFLRPGWLAAVPAALGLWWLFRSRANRQNALPVGLAHHLANALRVGDKSRLRIHAIDGVVATILFASVAAAGPTWSRVPSPFVAQTAPLAVALATTESMLGVDVAPSRLARAKHKLLDLLALRAGARTALIAYAGTAHSVVPLSEDPQVLKPFIEGLSPIVMPRVGDDATAALALARDALVDESVFGAILFILDEFDAADLPAFVRHAREDGVGVVFLALGSSGATLDRLARIPGSSVVTLTDDATDVRQIEAHIASAYRDALAQDDRQEWDDRGWLMAWPAALCTLLYFRRGWTMALGLICVLGGLFGSPEKAGAGEPAEAIAGWLLTPDQRGRLAFENGRFAEAAATFEDPMWKGYALYSGGRYDEAALTFKRVPSGEADFARAMALLKGRALRPSITAFESAIERDPNHHAARHNVEVARAVLAYLERVREESDTGEGSEGADKIVFDKEEEGGVSQMMGVEDRMKIESAEQWMRTVETSTAEFLSIRFALEEAAERR